MTNIITEQCATDEEYQFDIDLCQEIAFNTLSDLYELEEEVENFDFSTSVFFLLLIVLIFYVMLDGQMMS